MDTMKTVKKGRTDTADTRDGPSSSEAPPLPDKPGAELEGACDRDEMPFGLVALDLEGRITFANRKALDMTGCPFEKLVGTHFSERVHPDDAELVLQGFRDIIEGKADRYPVECRVVRSSGVVRQCSVDAYPISNSKGEVTGYQAIVVDLSEHGRTGNREQRIHLALRQSPWPYMELEPEGRIRYANPAAAGLLAPENPEEIVDLPFTRVIAGDQSSSAYQSFLEVSSGHKPYASGRWKVDQGEGGARTIEFRFFQDGMRVGRVERVLALLEEVGEREELAGKVKGVLARFEALMKGTYALIYETDADGLLSYIRGPVEGALGFSTEDIMGLPFPPYVHTDDLAKTAELLRRAAGRDGQGPVSGRLDFRLRKRDGTWGTFSLTANPVIEDGGPPGAVVGVMRDITEIAEHAKRLAEFERVFGGLTDSESVWAIVCDADSRVEFLSRAYEKCTGFEAAECKGKPLETLLAPGGEEAHDRFMKAREPGETGLRVRLAFRRAEGDRPCIVELEPTALRDDEGRVVEIIGFGRDVTGEAEREAAEDERGELARELRELRSEVQGLHGLDSLIGRDPKMRAIYETILAVSRTQATVLIQGDTGTGKELVAKAVHYNSPRRDRPFVKVDCGALAENLLESELFGHVKGAFTGAVRDRRGRFELAANGTIFLDEVNNLSIALQAKLLRVVQEGAFEKVGGTKTQDVDVRIIAATNEDLARLVARKRFRKDLYYRLNVIPIKLPSLADRRGDVPLLVSSFIERFAERHGRAVTGISKEALDRLVEYDWPGNVRELENIVEQAVVFCRGRTIGAPDVRLPEPDVRREGDLLGEAAGPGAAVPLKRRLKEALEPPERRILVEALARTGGNKKRAAELLGISRSSLYEKLKKHELLKKKP